MISLGVLLVILGVGSLALPYLNLQFTFMDLVADYQPWAGVIIAAIGLITVLFGAQRRGRTEVVVASAPSASAGSSPSAAPASSAATSSAVERAGEPTKPVSTNPPAERAAWPTDPPERHDD